MRLLTQRVLHLRDPIENDALGVFSLLDESIDVRPNQSSA
jgi:hypothetical protein